MQLEFRKALHFQYLVYQIPTDFMFDVGKRLLQSYPLLLPGQPSLTDCDNAGM